MPRGAATQMRATFTANWRRSGFRSGKFTTTTALSFLSRKLLKLGRRKKTVSATIPFIALPGETRSAIVVTIGVEVLAILVKTVHFHLETAGVLLAE